MELVEARTFTPDGLLQEYVICAGGKFLNREDFKLDRVFMPLNVARHTPISGFYGRSFVDPLIPLNMEVEHMTAAMFENVQDWDLYGILVESTTSGLPTQIMRGQDGLKRARYEPDYTAPADLKPFNIPPVNSGMNTHTRAVNSTGFMRDRAARITAPA